MIKMAAILIIAYLFPGLITVESFRAALVAAFFLSLINTLIRPAFVFLTLPLTFLTFGLFLFVINGFMLWMVSYLVGGFQIHGFWGAVLGALLISLVSWVLSRFRTS
jgi:putative membrane protein